MPVVSRIMRHVRPQRDGTVRVHEQIIDSKDRSWYLTYKAPSEEEAVSNMNTRDLTEKLKDVEEIEAVEWVREGKSIESFVRHDLSARELTDRLAKRIAEEIV